MAEPHRVVLASGNTGKLRELGAMLASRNLEVHSQREFAVPAVEETGETFVENAILKARNAARVSGLPVIADDSGLEVDVLHGQPGVHSARYAGDGASDDENLRLLLERVRATGAEQPAARFHCVIVFLRHAGDPMPVIAQGTWEGRIVCEPRGSNGFGYDPVFLVPDQGCTSAELEPALKNRISHRARAMQSLLAQLNAPGTAPDSLLHEAGEPEP